ncbi:hypothetical protein YPPY19_0217, partial [Yersinia pestis PY-19]
MTRFSQGDHGQISQRFIECGGDIAQVLFQRQIQVDSPLGCRANHQFFHIH